MQDFNIFGELKRDIQHFQDESVEIASYKNKDNIRYLDSNSGATASFSQTQTISAIDLAMNSVFKTGDIDADGKKKIFLNNVVFIRDVSRMKTDIDTKNYVLIPDGLDNQWPTYLLSREFKIYAREEDFGSVINRLGDDYCTYGWAVNKLIGKKTIRVPIKNLFNTQDDAEGLDHAAKNGGFCGEIHRDMSVHEMERYGWNTEGLEEDKKYTVYEKYSMIPQSAIDFYNKGKGKIVNEDRVLAVQILLLETNEKSKKENGTVLFIEKVSDTPYEEARWESIDGRTMPRGPVESQLENQAAQNLIFNIRRRGLLHSVKRLYQTQGQAVKSNLVTKTKDGAVLEVGPNGLITPIANENRNLSELAAAENSINENAKQRSFTFEVATGETMPSGTPFRLGVILNQAVEGYYNLKKEQFGLFLKRAFFSQQIKIFQQSSGEKILSIMNGEEGIAHLKDAMCAYHTKERVKQSLLAGQAVDPKMVEAQCRKEIEKSPYYYIKRPAGFYKDVKYWMDLDITGESIDTPADVESLTTLYQAMAAQQDPRAERVLEMIFAARGKNLQAVLGPKPEQIMQPVQQGQQQINQTPIAQNANAVATQ